MRPDWKVIDNPFGEDEPDRGGAGDPPDIALFHAPEADRFGNVRIGRQARTRGDGLCRRRPTLVTVERIVETSLLADEDSAAGVLPSLYVDRIAVAERGAWPLALWDEYPGDDAEVARYAAMARTGRRLSRLYLRLPRRRRQVA